MDDDQDIRQRYALLLERAGYAVAQAENGLAALAMLQEITPSVILSDVRMAFLEGRRFYTELTTQRPELASRVIFITGHGDDPSIRQLAADTGRRVLTKPIEAADLIAGVAALMR